VGSIADWRTALLQRVGAKPTQQNLRFLETWQRLEGGHTNNDARFNWLNTTVDGPGAVRDINSVGVTAFDSFNHGVGALAKTLENGRYGDVIAALRSGNPYQAKPVAGLSTWLSGSPNSASGAKYASRVLGTPIEQAKGAARSAYDASPAAVVNGPSPNQLLAFRQQAVGALLQMSANTVAGRGPNSNWDALGQLGAARAGLMQAQAQATLSEQDARQTGGTTMPPEGAIVGAKGKARSVLEIAAAQVGKPYVWGAESPAEGGFDCSGLIDYSFRKAGIKLPVPRLTTQSAMKLGISVKGKPLQPGDWLITNGGKHMVIYAGGGQVISAPHSGAVVRYQPVTDFENSTVDVRRVLG
jgi:cell wall-associated NlpC family hydrolase